MPHLLAALVGANIIVLFGVKITFLEALLHPEYYKAMAGSLPIALLLVVFVSFVTRKLDARWRWAISPLHRGLAQLAFGLLPAALAAFLLAALYFRIRGVSILDTPYLRFDFPVILLLIAMMNLLFVLESLYKTFTRDAEAVEVPANKTVAGQALPAKQALTVYKGNHVIRLPLTSVAYLTSEDDYRYLRTFEGERYMIPQTLDELETILPAAQFFRANRRLILSLEACSRYEAVEHGKLQIITDPVLPENPVVSQRRAKAFRDWIDQ